MWALIAAGVLLVVWLLVRRFKIEVQFVSNHGPTFLQLLHQQGYKENDWKKFLSLTERLRLAVSQLEDEVLGAHLTGKVISAGVEEVPRDDYYIDPAEVKRKLLRGFESVSVDSSLAVKLLKQTKQLLEKIRFASNVAQYNTLTQEALDLFVKIDHGVWPTSNPYWIHPRTAR